MFEKIYIEISNICNLKCTFCPEVEREQKIISIESFKSYALQAKPLAKQICLHLMGEPLAHPNFQKIMEICDELGVKIFLTTNGTLIKRHHNRLLEWKSLEQINFSVHSFFSNEQKNNFDYYIDPILKFSSDAINLNKDFYINLRLWNLEASNRQNNENNVVFDKINHIFNINLNQIVDVKHNKSKKIKHKLYVHFDTKFEWPSLKNDFRSKHGSCYGLRKQLGIHANGDVVPCCLDKEAILKLGNMNTHKLIDIIKTQKSQKIKSGFEQGVLVEDLCQKCQYADRFRV